ncbi:hypothetical protein H8356DRAFT_1359247 [Neocallimastix lanati (nom. inval.)]|nr:hypothetical protein H8356DRAFT_1359247 [Neocallimastix sp. JGI-2020a]
MAGSTIVTLILGIICILISIGTIIYKCQEDDGNITKGKARLVTMFWKKSTSSFIIMIEDLPTTESEYINISNCVKHSSWCINYLIELNIINVENKAPMYNCQNRSINTKSKHIDYQYNRKNNLADGFTKNINNKSMNNFRNNLLIRIYEITII